LRDRGIHFIGPDSGHLASGLAGVGRMSEPADIFGKIRFLLSRDNYLKGKRILVTAGGTQEAIDPYVFITNRSSGSKICHRTGSFRCRSGCYSCHHPYRLEAPYGCEKVLVKSAEGDAKQFIGSFAGL
jgi:phosphopantothenoylcysteine decarboxylase/phosphopantothenate--cysteine ligase